jgi:hypothetical protein
MALLTELGTSNCSNCPHTELFTKFERNAALNTYEVKCESIQRMILRDLTESNRCFNGCFPH